MEKRKKIFISTITSKLGSHIVQTLRDDHIKLDQSSIIVGSHFSTKDHHHQHRKYEQYHQQQFVKPNSAIHAVVDFWENRELIGKYVIEADILFIDFRTLTPEIQYITKILQCKAKQPQLPSNQPTQNPPNHQTIILLCSHLTSCYPRATIPSTPQQSVSPYMPHQSFTWAHSLQQQLYSLNSAQMSVSIVTCGLMYGRDMPSLELELLMARCWTLGGEVQVWGDGENVLPLVHVQDFCQMLQVVLDIMEKQGKHGRYICVDRQPCTQLQIVQSMLKYSGYIKIAKPQPLQHIHPLQLSLSQSIQLSQSPQFKHLTPFCQSLASYFSCHPQQPAAYLNLCPKHYILYRQQLQSCFSLPELESNLSTVIQVFTEEHIIEELLQLHHLNNKNQLDIHEVTDKIVKDVFQKCQFQNYVVVVEQSLFQVDVVKDYGLVKLDFQNVQQLLGWKYQQYTAKWRQEHIDTNAEQTNNTHTTTQNRHLTPQSQQSHIRNPSTQSQQSQQSSSHPKPTTPPQTHPCPTKPTTLVTGYIPQQSQQQKALLQKEASKQAQLRRKQKKQHRKIDQYLLDNVVVYLAQAFQQLQANSNRELPYLLENFVQELKVVYQRENAVYSQDFDI